MLFKLHNLLGLSGWQWLFLIEGIPSVIFGIIVLFFLPDGPGNAKWLTNDEKNTIMNMLEKEKEHKGLPHSYKQALVNKNVWKLAFLISQLYDWHVFNSNVASAISQTIA